MSDTAAETNDLLRAILAKLARLEERAAQPMTVSVYAGAVLGTRDDVAKAVADGITAAKKTAPCTDARLTRDEVTPKMIDHWRSVYGEKLPAKTTPSVDNVLTTLLR
jgi:hypothetical protein